MSIPLAITAIAALDVLIIAALAFVMTRARLLTPHAPAPLAALNTAQPSAGGARRRPRHARHGGVLPASA